MRFVLAVLFAFLSVVPARAQEEATAPRFDPQWLEGEWIVVEQHTRVGTADAIVPGGLSLTADLAGPQGARASVGRVFVPNNPTAMRRTWDYLNEVFENLRTDFEADYSSESDLEDVPPPEGCSDVRRMTGTESLLPVIPVGVTLCVADPDTIVIAVASGEVNELTGYEASDALVELVLANTALATPEATE